MSSSRSMVSVNAIVFAGLGLGLLNNIIIAALFGLDRGVDAFFAASLVPTMFSILCIDYLGRNFLPVYARAKKESETLASEVTSSIVTIVFVLATAVAVLLALLSGPLFALLLPGFEAPELALVRRHFLIMAPTLVLMAVSTFHEYVGQHDEQYVHVISARTALPLVNLSVLLALGPVLDEYSLSLAFLLGHLAVFVLMARQARYRFVPRFRWRREWERRVFTNSAVLMGSGLAARVPPLIANYIASMLGPGAIAALAFANKLVEPIGRSTLTGVRMLVFSRSARLFLERNTKEMSRLYGFALGASFLVMVPGLAWIALNAEAIVGWLFQRGSFDAEMATLVAAALVGYLPCAVLYGLNTLLSNAFYAANRIAVPALVLPLGTVVYVALAWPLARELGVLGLTLTYSISAAVTFVIMLVLLPRLLAEFHALETGLKLAGYTALAAIVFGMAQAALGRFPLDAAAIALASLLAGSVLYAATLAIVRDGTWLYLWRYLGSAVTARPRPG